MIFGESDEEDRDLWPWYALWQFGWAFAIGALLLLGSMK